jgi:phage recombination protein Bet
VTLVKNNVAKGATDQELAFLLTVARRYKLDPFKKQIWFIKRWDKNAENQGGGKGAFVWTPQVGIDGLLFAAARDHKQDLGSIGLPEYGPMVTVKYGNSNIQAPEWAKVKVWKKGESVPTEAVAWWDEYAPYELDKAPFWRKMPRRMISKCAIALAVRQSYPDLGGLYIPEECERMNEEYTPEGRQIVQSDGSLEAAQHLAQEKLKAHEEGKPIESQPDAPEVLTVTVVPWKEGRMALSGNGLSAIKSELGPEVLEELDIKLNAKEKVVHIASKNVFTLVDRAKKFGVEVTLVDAAGGAE